MNCCISSNLMTTLIFLDITTTINYSSHIYHKASWGFIHCTWNNIGGSRYGTGIT